MIETKKPAPDFSLPDQSGVMHSLTDYLGKWVLLYAYPKDNTPGCTKEACSIRDVWADFEAAGIAVLGISGDSVASHKKFAEAHNLPFILLSDEDRQVMGAYGILKEKSMFGNTFLGINRMSYLIDPKGIVQKVYPKVKPEEHADEVLADVKSFSA